MKAALGSVSAGGIGTPESDVTQNGGGPCAFVAIQPNGNAGGVTPSKFSLWVVCCQQGLHGGGVGLLTVKPLFSGIRLSMAHEYAIVASKARTTETNTIKQTTNRSGSHLDMQFGFVVIV